MIERMPQIADKKPGDVVDVVVMRDGQKKELKVTLTVNETVRFKTSIRENATPEQLAVRKRWMGI